MTDKTVVEKNVTETTTTDTAATNKAEKKDKKHRKPLTAEFYEMAKTIEDGFRVDATGAVEEVTPGSAYEKTLPDKWTIADVNELQEHNTTFVAASAHACGKISARAMAENKDVAKCAGSVKMSNFDHGEYVVHRSAEHMDPHTKNMVQKPGHIDVKYVAAAGKKSTSLKKVKDEVSSLFADVMK